MLDVMSNSLKASDLLPLVRRLPPSERALLAKMLDASHASDGDAAHANDGDATRYDAHATEPDEFGSDDDALAWDADGWEEFDAPR